MQPNTQSTNQQTHNRSLSGTASMLTNQFSDLTSNFSLKNNPISSSPAKNVSSFLSRATSITSSVTSNVAGVAGRISSGIKDIGGKSKVLLIIDDCQTDWSKYFRTKRLVGDYDIKVEQTEFRDISVNSNSDYGTIFSFNSDKNNPKRQIKPDFVFVRQHVKDSQDDFTSIILGLKYGNIPSVNSLLSVYNFIDRPLIYSELINIQRRIGKENFPLIEQTFYPSYKEMLNNPPKFPCVIKMGHSHGGLGKLKADSLVHFQELLSILACINVYLTVEPYIDAKCDVHIQKIGNNYKAFMRKSISGGWKSNMGSAVLEQIPITDKHKMWADEVSKLFGGLDLLTIEIVETKNNEQFIYEVTGSQMTLMGETQEEDRRLISDLITLKMQYSLNTSRDSIPKKNSITHVQSEDLSSVTQQVESPQPTVKPSGQQSFLKRMGSISGSISNTITSVASNTPGTNLLVGNKFDANNSAENPNSQQTSTTGQIQQQVTDTVDRTAQQIRGLFRRNSQSTNDENISNQNTTNTDDTDDTMKNLRKTFAGIFGDG